MTEDDAKLLLCKIDSALAECRYQQGSPAVWVESFKTDLAEIVKRDAETLPYASRDVLECLEACFGSADAGGFQGDTEGVTEAQAEAARRWLVKARGGRREKRT